MEGRIVLSARVCVGRWSTQASAMFEPGKRLGARCTQIQMSLIFVSFLGRRRWSVGAYGLGTA
jgi:hypothetical protein